VQRVVITGCGAVSPVGNTAPAYWESLKRATSGLGPPTLAPIEDLTQKVVAEVKDFAPSAHFTDRQLAFMDRVAQLGVVAAREAIAHSGLDFAEEALAVRTATIIGTAVGGQTTQDDNYRKLYKEGARRLPPFAIPRLMVNAASSQISMHCGLKGPAFTVASACASGTHAAGLAFQMVRSGAVACAVTGGAEASIAFGPLKVWEAMRIMAPDACRPFSRDRKGMILGEGAAVLVLEPLESARQRGAEILGEIVGFGMSADAKDITNPDAGGMARAIRAALDDAKLAPADVQYVNAHGTGTGANDETETQALKDVFAADAQKLAISSTKSMVGHSLGASGALELVATLMAMRDSVAPPTIGYLGPDPACDLDCIPNEARELRIDAALSNSFAFGGLNAVLAVRRWQG
jgi:nodulation protein E